MRKKTKFYSLLFLMLIGFSLTSCNAKKSNLSPTNQNQGVEDNELSKKVFNEYLESFPNSNYEDFLINGNKVEENDYIKFTYNSSSFYLKNDGVFICKEINNQSTITHSEYINNKWVDTRESKYINGKKYDIYRILINLDGTYDEKTELIYDSKGNALTVVYLNYKDDEWVNDRRYEYTYDSDGHRLTSLYSRYDYNEWEYINEVEYTYNSKGQLITSIQNNYNVPSFKTEYTYDLNGNRIIIITSSYEKDKWEYTRKVEHTYDSNGNKLYYITSRFIDGEWYTVDKNEFVYDSNGYEIAIIKTCYDEVFGSNTKTEYTYDSNGNKLTTTTSVYKDNYWQYTTKTENKYDLTGVLLTKTIYDCYYGEWYIREND